MATAQKIMRAMGYAALVAFAAEASAQTDNDSSANTVYRACKILVEGKPTSTKEVIDGNFCSGILYGIGGITRLLVERQYRSCIPPEVRPSQTARVVLKFLDEHPERMHEDFRLLAVQALHNTWPCN